ncbi:MAG: hypothetical protein FJW97_08975 [Actinobacteria bacterium]|nr:hypothetical protein [Actinomycetota bacterium]
MFRKRRATAAIAGIAVAAGLWLAAPLLSSAVAVGISAEDEDDGGGDGGGEGDGGGDSGPAEPAKPEPAPSSPTTEATKEPTDPGDADPSDGAVAESEDEEPDSADEDLADEDLADEDFADEDLADEDFADEDLADEDFADEAGDDADTDSGSDTTTEESGGVEEGEEIQEGSAELGLVIEQSDGISVAAQGSGLMPDSRAELWVFSTPQLLAQGVVDSSGTITLSATLPTNLAEGSHTVLLKGTDSTGAPVEYGSSVEIGPNGELLGVTEGVDVSALVVPELPDNPKAPQFPKVSALDQPAAVVSATIAAVALLSVTGAGLVGASRSNSPSGGGINESLAGAGALLLAMDVAHNRGWRTRFTARGGAAGDRSWLYRSPLTSYVDEASYLWPEAVSTKSPLLARILGDAAPIRAIFGSLSALLPVIALVLGLASAVTSGGIAQPPVTALLIALIVIGVLDALAGLVGVLAFSITVILMGGVIDLTSVRTLMGVGLLIIGPGLIATSFREIRRAAPQDFAQWWERGADLIIVPLLGAFTTYNVANSMPSLGGSLFPVAESSGLLAIIVAGLLIVKVLLEEAAARWFPERFATVVGDLEEPGTAQCALSAMLKLAVFLFVSAAFIGTSWQLWVGGAVWFIPVILAIVSSRVPNNSRLWQILPQSLPLLSFNLFVFLIIASIAGAILGDTPDFALTSFVILLIPGVILGILTMFGRAPLDGDVRWYLRPSMTTVYRVGGILVLTAAVWLAADSIF